jgi:hypothetical protein
MSNQLIGNKSLVIFSLISITVLIFSVGGFEDMPEVTLPTIVLPEIDLKQPEKIPTLEKSMSTQCQKAYTLGPNKWYKENCM